LISIEDLNPYYLPNDERASVDFSVKVNGKPVFVYMARVSAVPLNQIWPGYQRPLDQTEIASFTYWDMDAPVSVEVTSEKPIDKVTVRPLSCGIKPEVKGGRILFEMASPKHITVEVNGKYNALHLFINPVEEFDVDRDDKKVRYYGPGVHKAGKIVMNSGEIVFIDDGAIVHGVIEARHASGIRILGRGILDTSTFKREEAEASISLYKCNDVVMDGIIIRDPNLWTIVPAACSGVRIHNVKLIGLWRYNTDGIDIVNSQHVRIEKCFIRSFDDSIAIKGMKCWPWEKPGDITDDEDVRDIHVEDCVIWNDWGRSLEIGAETCAQEMSHIRFCNCDIIHTTHIALDIQHSDRAAIRDVGYEDIRVEMDEHLLRPVWQQFYDEKFVFRPEDSFSPQLLFIGIGRGWWGQDNDRGSIWNVYLKNIAITAKFSPESILYGSDESHIIDGVTFENLKINGKMVKSKEEGFLKVGGFVDNVRFY